MTSSSTSAAPARKPRGQYAKTAETRATILAAALEVFAESGFRAGSIREVAQRVGMSEAGLLHHFRNKTALLEAVLEQRDDQARGLVPLDSPDGVEVLEGLVALAVHNASIPGMVELFTTLSAEATSPDHPAHEYFLRRYEYTRERVGRAFADLHHDGRLRHGIDPQEATIAVIALMDGLQVQWLFDRSVVDMASALRRVLSVFVDIDWERASPPA